MSAVGACKHRPIAAPNAAGSPVGAAAATCTAGGNVEYWHCERCGKNYADSAAGRELASVATGIDPNNHSLTHVAAVAATCTKVGNIEYWHCAACGWNLNAAGAGLEQVLLPVDPDAHSLVHHEAKAATCTEAGYAAYDACARCGYTTLAKIDALGHDYGAPVVSWSEGEHSCTLTFTCKNDPSHQLVRTVALGALAVLALGVLVAFLLKRRSA